MFRQEALDSSQRPNRPCRWASCACLSLSQPSLFPLPFPVPSSPSPRVLVVLSQFLFVLAPTPASPTPVVLAEKWCCCLVKMFCDALDGIGSAIFRVLELLCDRSVLFPCTHAVFPTCEKHPCSSAHKHRTSKDAY